MTLDDVYGTEHDRFPLEQERKPMGRTLDWDDAIEGRGSADIDWRRAAPQSGAPVELPGSTPPIAVLLRAPRGVA